jgi:hypothetical protein
MKVRVTIDIGKADEMASECLRDSSMSVGVFGVDLEGVYNSWYGSPNYLCEFEDLEIISHDGETKFPTHSEECEAKMNCSDCKTIREMKLNVDVSKGGLIVGAGHGNEQEHNPNTCPECRASWET